MFGILAGFRIAYRLLDARARNAARESGRLRGRRIYFAFTQTRGKTRPLFPLGPRLPLFSVPVQERSYNSIAHIARANKLYLSEAGPAKGIYIA